VELLEKARAVGSAIFAKMLAAFSASETAALESYLRRCIAALEADTNGRAAAEPAVRKTSDQRSSRRQARHAAAP
jgi:hypothetical protein